jgi:hypothetical protein
MGDSMSRAVDINGRGVRVEGRGVGVGSAIPDSGLKHHFDATEISGSDGDSISTWPDKAGSKDLTQATSSNQPTLKTGQLNGNDVVSFSLSTFLDVAFSEITQANHVFIVAKADKLEDGRIFDSETGSDSHSIMLASGSSKFALEAGSRLRASSWDKNWHIHSALFNGASSIKRLDGSQTASGDAGSLGLDGITVGQRAEGASEFQGDVAEILVYDQELTDSDRDAVESYLSDKWGITI